MFLGVFLQLDCDKVKVKRFGLFLTVIYSLLRFVWGIMRHAGWSRGFYHNFLLFSVVTYQVVIRVECEQLAQYRTIDVSEDESGKLDADRRISEQDEFAPRTGSLDIQSRYWTTSADEPEIPEYRNQEEPEESSYSTIAGDESDQYTSPSDSGSEDGQHAYVTVDRKDKEHLVTINMPKMRMSGKNHIFKKFVIQPVIQYVVQYDKRRQRRGEDDEVAAQASTNYEEYEDGQRQERMRQGHEQRVDRYFNDIDAQFDTYWGGRNNNEEGSGNNGGYSSSDGRGQGNSHDRDYDFGEDGNGGGGYVTTNQMHQPPNVNAFVSGGGYGNDASTNGGTTGDSGIHLANAAHGSNNGNGHAQNQNQQQFHGGRPFGHMGMNNMNMAGQFNSFAGTSASHSGMGGRGSPNSLYGVPGMAPGQPLDSQQMMMSTPGSGGTGAIGGGGMGHHQGAIMQGGMLMSTAMGQSQGMGNAMGISSGLMGGQQISSGMMGGGQQISSGMMGGGQQISSGMMGGGQQISSGVMGGGQQISSGVISGGQQISSGVMGGGQQILSGVISGGQQISSGVISGGQQISSGVISGGQQISSAMGGSTSSGMGSVQGTLPGIGGTLGTLSVTGGSLGSSSGISGAFGSSSGMSGVSGTSSGIGNSGSSGGGGSGVVSTSTIVGNQMEGFAQHLSGMVNNAAAAAGVGAMLMSALSAGGISAQSQISGQNSGAIGAADGVAGSILNGNLVGNNVGLAHAMNNIIGASGSFGGGVSSSIGSVPSPGGAQSNSMSTNSGDPSPAYGPPSSSSGEPQGNSGVEDDDARPPRGKKPGGGIFGGGRGKGKGRRGKSLLASLPKLPSAIGGHLSFMFSTGFGKGRRGNRSGGGGGGSSKPSGGSSSSDDGNKPSNSKVIDKEQVSDHILNILGLTVHHPPPSKLVGGGGGSTLELNNSSHTNNPILLWEQQGNSSTSLLPSHIPGATREEVVAHLPVPFETETKSSTSAPPHPRTTPEADSSSVTTTMIAMTTEETTDISTTATSITGTTETPVENVTITATPPTISPPTSTVPTLPLIARPNQQQIRKPKTLSFPSQASIIEQTPAIFFTPPPPPPPISLSPFPTMVTVYDQNPLQEYMNDNLFNKVVATIPEDQKSKQENTSNPPNIAAYYADDRYPENPVKLAQFDPWIYDALQAAFQPGHLISDDNIGNNGVYFEALKRKKRRRNRFEPILVDMVKSRSREFHKKESVNNTTLSTPTVKTSSSITL